MLERWYTGKRAEMGVGMGVPMQLESVDRALNGELIEVADTGTAGTVVTLRHGLGRIPRGMVVVNVVGTGAVGWYRLSNDSAWTTQEISVRFDRNNARVLVEIF
jgi:hypothetical protein